jgi:hypothetical protein
VFSLVPGGLNRRKEVAIPTNHDSCVVKVHERERYEIRSHVHVNAFFHHRLAVSFGDAHPYLKIRRFVHRLEELALFRGDIWIAFGILTDVVVVSPDQPAVARNLFGELSEVQIVSSADFSEDVVKVAPVDEHHDSFMAISVGRRSRCRH